MSKFASEEKAAILSGVLTDGGEPTDTDLTAIASMKRIMRSSREARKAGLDEGTAVRLAIGEENASNHLV